MKLLVYTGHCASIKFCISEIEKKQETLVRTEKIITKEIESLERKVTKFFNQLWEEAFPGIAVGFSNCFDAACMTNKWTAEIYVYAVNNSEYFNSKWYNILYEGESWDYKIQQVKPPISTKKLRAFLKEFSEQTGCMAYLTPSTRCSWTKLPKESILPLRTDEKETNL